MDTVVSQDYERVLIDAVRILPLNRVEQLVDFARFLEAQILAEEIISKESVAEIEADNAQWDTLMVADETQGLLEKLADEALVEHRAGKTKPMVFDSEATIGGSST
jgi:hypothetical protein